MMTVDSQDDLAGLFRIGRLVAETLRQMRQAVQPGISTGELDLIAARLFEQHGARSAPIVTYNYPGQTCISIDDEAAHGIPGSRVLREGDLVKLDVSAELNGYFADAAITVGVLPLTPRKQKLLDTAQSARDEAIAAAKAGHPLNRIGRAAQTVANRGGFNVIRELPGHGIGRKLHEAPSVPTVFIPRLVDPLDEGLVITVEPHLTPGSALIRTDSDGWTLRTTNGTPVAAFEHTIVISGDQPIILTEL